VSEPRPIEALHVIGVEADRLGLLKNPHAASRHREDMKPEAPFTGPPFGIEGLRASDVALFCGGAGELSRGEISARVFLARVADRLNEAVVEERQRISAASGAGVDCHDDPLLCEVLRQHPTSQQARDLPPEGSDQCPE
jgi:hypothetical protein